LGGRGRDDLRPGQISRAGDPRPFAREVVREVDPLGGDQPGGPLLLLGDLRQFPRGKSVQSPEESRKALPERRFSPFTRLLDKGWPLPFHQLDTLTFSLFHPNTTCNKISASKVSSVKWRFF
jgi:hypothetical protein